MPMPRLLRILAGPCLSAAACLLGFAADATAQTIQGIIVVGDSITTIHGARIRLQLADRFIGQVFSDSAGRFTIFAGQAGDFRLEVSQLGYETVLTDVVSLARGKTVEVTVRLGVRPVQLPAITVRPALEVSERASYDGMLARHAAQSPTLLGSRVVLKRGDPEFDASATIRDLLAYLPRRRCTVYFHNGIPVHNGIPGSTFPPDESTSHISAIELYRSYLEAPREYRSNAMFVHPGLTGTAATACGMIVIWTNR